MSDVSMRRLWVNVVCGVVVAVLPVAMPAFAQEAVDAGASSLPATTPTATSATAPASATEPSGGFRFGGAQTDTEWSGSEAYFEDASAIDALLEEPRWDDVRFSLDGYYRLRYNYVHNPDVQGAGFESGASRLGYGQHRLRLLPSIGLNDKTFLKADFVVGQGVQPCDVAEYQSFFPHPCNGIFGANGVTVLDTQLSDAFGNLTALRFWGEVTTPIGVIRAGRQPSHWGMGIFANDGLHESEFGDPQFGDTFDRLTFATKPLGEDSDLIVAAVYDLISEGTPALGVPGNPQVQRSRDNINEGIVVLLYKTAPLDLGLYQVFRRQRKPFETTIYVTDLYGRLDIGLIYGTFEILWVYGDTKSLPFLDQAPTRPEYALGQKVDIGQFGWASELGLRFDWYDIKLKLGSAQGDQNLTNEPKPKVTGFSFNPDYNVGLIMFEYAYANLIEERIANNFDRLGVLVDDGVLTQAQVDEMELSADLSRTQGGVSNAFYLNPIAVLEPVDGLVTKLGILWAQSNTGLAVLGEGSNAKYAKDLGWEFDAGVEYTFRKKFSIGVEGGVFLPGSVFDRPETEFDEVTGLDVPVATSDLMSADPMYLGQFRLTYRIR